MATERLIIELDARTAELDAKLKKIDKRLDNVSKGTDKADAGLKKFSNAASATVAGVAKLATAVTALAAASTAMVLASASNRRELELLSRQAKTSAEDFQALSFATSQYGVNAEQIADISKDVSDKVGEFARDATGPFQDYANQLKLTKEEAQDAALAFENMSSEQVLGEMVSRMEDAGTSGDQMTQVLESMGNDLSKLAPLFANNSKELNTLKARFNDVNSALQITDTQALALQETSESWSLLTGSLGNSATAISATVAPVFDDFFNDVIAVVPQATQTLIDFFNSALSADKISSIEGAKKEILDTQEEIDRLRKREENLYDQALDHNVRQRLAEEERLEALKKQLGVLEEQQKVIDDAKVREGGEIGGTKKKSGGDDGGGSAESPELQAIRDSLATQIELEQEAYEKKKEILDREVTDIDERNALKFQLRDEHLDRIAELEAEEAERVAEEAAESPELEALRESLLTKEELLEEAYEIQKEILDREVTDLEERTALKLALDEKYANDKLKLAESEAKTDKSIQNQKVRDFTKVGTALLSSSKDAANAVFDVAKDKAAGEIEAYGLSAGAKALAELGPIAGPPVAASYIGWSQVAAGVVRALPLGGGGGGAGTPDSSASGTANTQESEFEQETRGLELTQSSAGGTALSTINIATESDDDLIELIAAQLEQRMREGN